MNKFSIKLGILLISLLSFALYSCGDDEGEETQPAGLSSLVGTWRYDVVVEGIPCFEQITFSEGNRFTWTSGEFHDIWYTDTDSGKYTVGSGYLRFYYDEDEEEPEVYKYTLSGNKLTLIDPEDGENYVFLKK